MIGVPLPSDMARRSLCPTGVLRAGINLSNFLLVSGQDDDGAPDGVSPAMAHALARALGVELQVVAYNNPGAVADAASNGEWDIGNIGSEKLRAEVIDFSSAYVEIPCTLLVPAGSSISTYSEADQPGMRIATRDRAAYSLWLAENLQHAELVTASSIDASFDLFVDEGLDALAGLRPRLLEDAKRIPGATVVEGQFRAVQQAIGVPKGRAPEAGAYVDEFVTFARESGLVASLIEHFAVVGLEIT